MIKVDKKGFTKKKSKKNTSDGVQQQWERNYSANID